MSELANYKSEINETWSSTDMYHLHVFHLLITSSFLLLKNDTVVPINDLQSHFYVPHFRNLEIEKKIKNFTQTKKTDYYLIKYWCINTIPKDFSPSFHISYLGSFFSPLRTRDLLTVIFQTKNDATYLAKNALKMVAAKKAKQLWILYMKVISSFYYLSMPITKILLLRNFLCLFSVVCTYISWMKYVQYKVSTER